jgi:FMN phosphatase YigB (HAD superfamily)
MSSQSTEVVFERMPPMKPSPPPETYTGSTEEWRRLTPSQRFKIKHPNHQKDYNAQYRKDNKESLQCLKKDHYDQNKQAIREHQKEYNAKEDVRLNNLQIKAANREHNREMEKTYRDKKRIALTNSPEKDST